MKNSFGSSVILTLFGESHGIGIGAVLDGLAPGITVDEDFIRSQLSLRRPVGDISTPRAEPDNFVIESGVFGGKTTGTPICIVIPNVNTRSKDYSELRSKARRGMRIMRRTQNTTALRITEAAAFQRKDYRRDCSRRRCCDFGA